MIAVYRFLDVSGSVIYVGRSNRFEHRMRNEHFTDRGHLPEECYREAVRVEYSEVTNENESKVYELYLIGKYRPKYNNVDVSGGSISFNMPELQWKEYEREQTFRTRLTKQELVDEVVGFGEAIEEECNYIGEFLRGKDRVTWLSKLDYDEQNEYVSMIYSMERLVNGIRDLKDEKLDNIK